MEEIHNGLAVLIVILMLGIGVFAGLFFGGGTKIVEVDKIVIQEKLVEKECPVCPDIVIPEIENADNVLLNEFLESEFEDEYNAIKGNATEYALEELEDHSYRVVVDYLESLLAEGEELDWSEVSVDDTEVKVTKLGLGEDEDKSARVTFEVEVEYELEEGVRDEFEKDFVVVYDVVFEEGDFSDEEVTFVSIV